MHHFAVLTSIACPAPHHWQRCWRLIVALLLGTLVQAAYNTQRVYAQNANCGEPERSQGVGGQADATLNRTFKLERCVIRTFTFAGQTKKIVAYYTLANGIASDHLLPVDTNGDGTDDLTSEQIASRVAEWTETAWRTYRSYGLGDPLGQSTFRIHIFDSRPGLGGWCCQPDQYEIDGPIVRSALRNGGDSRDAESIVYHEMWHAMEGNPFQGGWVTEGSASYMTDRVTLPVDNDDDNDYIGRVNGFMGWGHQASLTDLDYVAAPWWAYFTERLTTINTEPNRGVDIMREFMVHPATTPFARIEAMLQARPQVGNLRRVWLDFAVTNYVKRLRNGVPPQLRYQDELQPGAPKYADVQMSVDATLTATSGSGPTLTSIKAWAAHYYRFSPAANVPIINLEFRQDANRTLGYALLKIRNNDLVEMTYSVGRDFVSSFANDNYTHIVVVVASFGDYANFRYTTNATQPVLRLIDPLTSRKAQAGDPNAPDKILIKVEVLNPTGGGTPIAGIDPKAFVITVGNKAVPAADILSSAYIQGQYWLLLRAPSQATNGDYALTVAYSSLTAVEAQAVHYEAVKNADNVLVIDRSGSMAENGAVKMTAARDAARLYVDSWRNGDQVGVVSFNEDAMLSRQLGDYATTRQLALDAIGLLVTGGDTSIGDGVNLGLTELAQRGQANHKWAMVVLSDGIENRPEFIPAFLAAYEARKAAKQQIPKVHTVALGANADRARLEDLAAKTGGSYFFAALPTVVAGQNTVQSAATTAIYLSNDLAEIYRVAGEQVARQQQIYAGSSVLDYDDPIRIHSMTVDGAANEAIFILKWDKDNLGSDVTLRQPDGTIYTAPPTIDWLHQVWRVPAPQPGVWTLTVHFVANCDNCANEVLVEAAVLSDLTFDLYLGLPVEQRRVGKPMPLFASLADSQVIGDASIVAGISSPGGGYYSVTLYDDGLHNDSAAGDGFYGGVFYQTQEFGAYRMVVQATGVSPRTGAYVRRLRADFNMLEFRVWNPTEFPDVDPNRPLDRQNLDDPHWPLIDIDRDNLPDWWEIEFNLDPELDDNNQGDDTDFDGLTQLDEYNNSTDPTTSDTDKGGQNDGAEVSNGGNPLDPSDDAVACPYSFYASGVDHQHDEPTHVDGNLLFFEVDPDHAYFFIWRATDPNGPREVLEAQAPSTGVYTDTTVVMGTTYYYWLSAYDAEGHASCILGPVSLTASADPIAPEGLVTINDGAAITANPNVTLTLNASGDTTEMQIHNNPGAYAPDQDWVAYVSSRPWQLINDGGYGRVYVWYRDGAGNVSEPAFDTIAISTTNKLEQTIQFASLPNRTLSASPVALSATADSGLPVGFSTATPTICTINGNSVTLLATGICTIVASQAGDDSYHPAAPVQQSFQITAPGQPGGSALYLPLVMR